jgi:diaminopimelate epimerase
VAHRFTKYEGLGNDFLIVEQARFPEVTPALAARLCHRHFGVGGDGILLTGLARGRPFMRVINADGSTPEMCGNGLRCVALYLVHEGLVGDADAKELRFEVDTDAGPHGVRVLRNVGERQREAQVEVQMRPASLEAGEVLRDERGRWVDAPMTFDGRALRVTAVSMGNPHAVLFDDVAGEAATLGPRIERDPRFKAGANVGFAQVGQSGELDLTVWERGVGFTLACGTGACAAAVAAVETGRAERHQTLQVRLPGGPLAIRVGEPGTPISMIGPARKVFEGLLELP